MQILRRLILLALFAPTFHSILYGQEVAPQSGESYPDFTGDGAWCWFSDPRAIYLHDEQGALLSGWVKQDGTIEAAVLNLKTASIQSQVLYSELEIDDHDNPAFAELADDKVLVSYTKHSKVDFYYHLAQGPGKLEFGEALRTNPISESQLAAFPKRHITYANPYMLESEDNRVYCFGRWTGYKPNLMWSDDQGKSFTTSRVFISEEPFDANNRPYVKYYSDGQSKIHIVFTDGHPRVEPTNSVYYACYEQGAFWRADGSKICTIDELPFEPGDASLVYGAHEASGRAWIHDIAADDEGRPFIAYARYPEETDHRYHYTWFDGESWIDHEVCKAGGWFPQTQPGKTEREPHYSGGMTLHPASPNVLYLSRSIDGVFELEQRKTSDGGKTWAVNPITRGSKYDQIRPYVPRNIQDGDPTVLLWMQNERYVHYTDYRSRIKYWVDESGK